MPSTDEFSEFHKRLDDFDGRLKEKTRQLEGGRSLSPDHRKEIDAIHAKAIELRRKVEGASPSSWGAMKKELETEWHTLSHAFEHWANHVDTSFWQRRK